MQRLGGIKTPSGSQAIFINGRKRNSEGRLLLTLNKDHLAAASGSRLGHFEVLERDSAQVYHVCFAIHGECNQLFEVSDLQTLINMELCVKESRHTQYRHQGIIL